jgi:C-terminal processing protease CtpA/Prc
MKILLFVCLGLLGSELTSAASPGMPGAGAGASREIEEFGGIGAVLAKDTAAQTIFVANVLPGLGAARAGLKQNDIISEVDGLSVYGKDLHDVVAMIRGPVGSSVEISVVRDPAQPPLRLVIVRQGVQVPK